MARLTAFKQETFEALHRIRETSLVRFDSLFSPNRRIWTGQELQRFHNMFLGRWDAGQGTFLEKLRKQLEGASDDTIQLAAELLYSQQFFTSQTGADKKLNNVREVLSWADRAVEIPQWAVAGVKIGLARDRTFNQHRPFHIAWLAEFLLRWHTLEETTRRDLLENHWRFREFTYTVESDWGHHQPMREAWLYMVFPDHFESISSVRHKQKIRDAFDDLLDGVPSSNIDRDLLEIRGKLTPEAGEGFHYYRPPLIERWQTDKEEPKKRQSPLGPAAPKGHPPEVASAAKKDCAPAQELSVIGAELLLDPAEVMEEWAEMLCESKQMIFQGPPGTGKTYLARRLSNAVAGSAERVTLVQFHPSYAYEDFVEGFRPTGAGKFELRDGPLKRAAARAAADQDHQFVLLIDEVNRGNLAKIFGELYFLLEYRDESINLQYSEHPFRLPPNLLVIGTMNTADRSIALLDMALRRRFKFVDLFPDVPPIKGILQRFLDANAPDMAFLASMIDYVNQQLDDPHSAVGPSHFLLKDLRALTEEKAERIWIHSVLPALADRFFDDPKALQGFAYNTVRTKTASDDAVDVAEFAEDEAADHDVANAD